MESYPEVVEPAHQYHYNQYNQKPQYPQPETWGQLEVVPPSGLPPISPFGVPPIENNTGENAPGGTVCGVRRTKFWLLVLLAVVIVIAAVGGGVGGALASKNKTPAAAVVTATVTNTIGGQTAPSNPSTPTSAPTSTATAMAEGGLESQGQVTRTGLTASRYQAELDKWTPLGYRLTVISGYSFGITDRYAAVWELTVGPTLYANIGLSSSQYQTDTDTKSGQGYFPVLVDAWTVNGADRYGSIWLDSEGKTIPAWVTRHALTKAGFQTELDKWAGQGYCIHGLSGYAVGTEPRYTALWRECPSGTAANATVLKYGMTPGQYQTQVNTMTALGYRVSFVNGYAVDNLAFYDSIFTLGSGTDWLMMYGLNSVNFQAKLEEMGTKGFKVTLLSGYTLNNNDVYAAIWDR